MKAHCQKLVALACLTSGAFGPGALAQGAPKPEWVIDGQVGNTYFFQEGLFEVVPTSKRNQPNHLFYRAMKPSVPSKAVLIIVHGLRSHSGRYADFAWRAIHSAYPVEVWAYDQLGHGRSDGWDSNINQPVEGQVKDIHVLSEQLSLFVQYVKSQVQAGVPIFILSHSMGGLVTYTYGTETSEPAVKGMIFLSPALRYFTSKFYDPIKWASIKNQAVKVGGTLGLGKAKIPLAQWKPTRFLGLDFIDPSRFTHDPDYRSAMKNDPLVNSGSPTIGTGYALIRAIDENLEKMKKALQLHSEGGAPEPALGIMGTLPVLFIHGTSDRITNPKGSVSYYADLMALRNYTPTRLNGRLAHAKTWVADDGSELDLVDRGFHDLFGEESETRSRLSRALRLSSFVREDFEGHVLNWIQETAERANRE